MSKKIGQLLKDNSSCADCQSKGPKWVSVSFGVVVCTECSGVHRSLQSCMVKGVDDEFLPAELEFLGRFGNTKANEILEKYTFGSVKPNPKTPYGEKEAFIKQKYEALAFAPNRTFPKLASSMSQVLDQRKRASMLIIKQGFLSKRGNSYKSWKRRYFVLVDDSLSYFKSPGDPTPIGVIQLLLSNVVSTKDEKTNSFKLVTPSRTYYFEADSAPEVDGWVEAIKDASTKLASSQGATSQTSGGGMPGVPPMPGAIGLGSILQSSRSGSNITFNTPAAPQQPQFQELSGYLKKQGNSIRKDWKRRYFILKPDTLHYYKSKDDPRPVGCIHLLSCAVKTAAQVGGKHCFEIATPNRSYYAIAENAEEMSKWMQGIRTATQLLLDSFDSSKSVSNAAPAPGQTAKEIAQVVAAKEAAAAAGDEMATSASYSGSSGTLGRSTNSNRLSLGSPMHQSIVPPAATRNIQETRKQASEKHLPRAPLASNTPAAAPPAALLGEIQKGTKLREAASQPRPQSLKEGYLFKMGNNLIKDWPKRWCVLKDDCLSYYRDKKDQFPAGTIKLVTCHVKPNDKIRPLCLELITPNRSYFFCADNKVEQMGWINALSAACNRVMESFLEGQVGAASTGGSSAPPKSDSDPSVPLPAEAGGGSSKGTFQGYLNKKGKNVFKEFKRRWCVLREDFMYYYLNEGDANPLGVINLLLCTVKPMEQKGHYFEVILPTRSYYFQADSGEIMYQWINAIRDSSVRLFNELPPTEKEKAAALATSEANDPSSSSSSASGTGESESDEPRNVLKAWIQDPETGNDYCADCNTPDPRWASINLGIMVCIECSGIHRSLGTHISQVRSVDLDRWANDTVQFMMTLGNKKSNQIWEFDVPSDSKKPQPTDSRAAKEEWINQKYVMKKFANPEIVSKDDVQTTAKEKKLPSFFKEGYLTKQGNNIKTWKRRWFVLKVTEKTAFLFYYRTRGDPVAAGAIDLAYCIVRPATHNRANSFEIISPNRIYICVADTLPEMNSWLQKLKEVLEKYSKKDETGAGATNDE